MQQVKTPAMAETGKPAGTRQTKDPDATAGEQRPEQKHEKKCRPESAGAVMLEASGSWSDTSATVPQPPLAPTKGDAGRISVVGGASVIGLPGSGTEPPASGAKGPRSGELVTNLVSGAGMQAQATDVAGNEGGQAVSTNSTELRNASAADSVNTADSPAQIPQSSQRMRPPKTANDGDANENVRVGAREGVPAASFHSNDDPAGRRMVGAPVVDDTASPSPRNPDGDSVGPRGTPAESGGDQEAKDAVAPSAATADPIRQSVAFQPVPVSASGIKDDDKTGPALSGVTAIEGKKAGKKGAGTEAPERWGFRSEKSPTRTESDPPDSNEGTANRAGTMVNRMAEADVRSSLVQAAPTSAAAAMARHESRAGTASDGPAQTDHPESPAVPDHEGTGTQIPEGTQLGTTINSARLAERLKQSEINLNLRTLDFGNVSIHTAVNHDRLSAQISLERNDLGKAIASEVPSLESKLKQEHGIQATIEVQQQGHSYPGNGGQSQPQTARPQTVIPSRFEADVPETMINLPTAVADGRLDIRA